MTHVYNMYIAHCTLYNIRVTHYALRIHHVNRHVHSWLSRVPSSNARLHFIFRPCPIAANWLPLTRHETPNSTQLVCVDYIPLNPLIYEPAAKQTCTAFKGFGERLTDVACHVHNVPSSDKSIVKRIFGHYFKCT